MPGSTPALHDRLLSGPRGSAVEIERRQIAQSVASLSLAKCHAYGRSKSVDSMTFPPGAEKESSSLPDRTGRSRAIGSAGIAARKVDWRAGVKAFTGGSAECRKRSGGEGYGGERDRPTFRKMMRL